LVILGWRDKRELRGCRLDVHQDTYGALRSITEACLSHLGVATIRDYEPFAALESDQAMRIDGSGELPELDTAALLNLVAHAAALNRLAPAEMINKYLFYAIVWLRKGDAIPVLAVVRKQNARTKLGTGTFAYGEVLKSVKAPDFVLEHVADLIVHGTTLYLLNENSARLLLNDVGLARQGIADNVRVVKTILGGPNSMTPNAEAAIVAVAARKVNVARRLARMGSFFADRKIDRDKLKSAADRRCDSPREMISDAGIVCVTEDRVEEVLNLIEGRFYKDDVTDEERVAERVSRRARR